MRRSSDMRTGNRLLDALPTRSFERLQPRLEPVALVLDEPVHSHQHLYFPVAGLISVIATMADGASVETSMIGREGMYSVSAILGDDMPFQTAMVQFPGRALRLQTHTLRQEMQADTALQKLLLRYTQATLSAVAQSAACNRLHLLEQRCARWLLAFHDRAETDSFRMTQEFLAMMLGVRRPGITFVARSLQEQGLISYNHGTITVVDRRGLEAVAANAIASSGMSSLAYWPPCRLAALELTASNARRRLDHRSYAVPAASSPPAPVLAAARVR
jgi:CRP-like cAMP-binding protein